MHVGLNYPWKSYGHDFGGTAAPPWEAQLDAELAAFRSLGVVAIRWFILCHGAVFGSSVFTPLSQKFLDDFELLLQKCESAGIQLLPSLFDFNVFNPTVTLPDRRGIVTDPTLRAQFWARVLQPLLNVSLRHPTAVYAWEMINEPDWVTGTGKQVSLQHMLDFLAEGVSLINTAGFKSTVGFGKYATVQGWDSEGLGITMHQFHYYNSPSHLPPSNYNPQWPLILGEIPTVAGSGLFPELGATNTLSDRLNLASQKGYPITFLWAVHATDKTVDWSATTQGMVKQFAVGTP